MASRALRLRLPGCYRDFEKGCMDECRDVEAPGAILGSLPGSIG